MNTFFEKNRNSPSTVWFQSNLPIKNYHIGGIKIETAGISTWDDLRDKIAEKINESYREESVNLEVDPETIKVFVWPVQKLYSNENQPGNLQADIFSKYNQKGSSFPILCSTREIVFSPSNLD